MMSSNQCIARIWNNGYGARCTNNIISGEFCDIHGKRTKSNKKCNDKNCKNYGYKHFYSWEHLGRWDSTPPKFFNNGSCWSMNPLEFKEKPYKIEHKIINNPKTNKLKLVTIEYYSVEKVILSPKSKKILTKIPL